MKDTTNTKDFTANNGNAMLAARGIHATEKLPVQITTMLKIKLFVKERLTCLKNLFEKKDSQLPVKGKKLLILYIVQNILNCIVPKFVNAVTNRVEHHIRNSTL